MVIVNTQTGLGLNGAEIKRSRETIIIVDIFQHNPEVQDIGIPLKGYYSYSRKAVEGHSRTEKSESGRWAENASRIIPVIMLPLACSIKTPTLSSLAKTSRRLDMIKPKAVLFWSKLERKP